MSVATQIKKILTAVTGSSEISPERKLKTKTREITALAFNMAMHRPIIFCQRPWYENYPQRKHKKKKKR